MPQLPVLNDPDSLDCKGCGVCCLHMGYPAFILPADPLTDTEIEADPKLRKFANDARTRKRLRDGTPGEIYWHQLPGHLRRELEKFVVGYSVPDGQLDPPCFWLDMETRLCKHHQHRPRVCREFEIGSKDCQRWRNHYRDRIID